METLLTRWVVLTALASVTGCGAGATEPGEGIGSSSSGGSASSSGNSAASGSESSSAASTSASAGGGTSKGTGAGGGTSTGTSASGGISTSTSASTSAGGGLSTSTGVGGSTSTSTSGGGCQSNAACSDGVFCNGAETCVGGVCAPGAPPSCDDGISCTADACDEAVKSCSHTPNDAVCNNGIVCDGVEVCDALLGCVSTGAPSCSDSVACTDDFCDLASDSCKHVPNDTTCSDGLYCNGSESCDPVTGAPATGCLPGTPINCQDGIACTTDTCSNAAAACQHAPVDATCDDGIFCDGQETCNTLVGCQSGPAIVCDDGLSCTLDACSEAQAKCVYSPVNAACDDGLFCDGQETCDPAGAAPSGCKPGLPFPCPSDGIACTIDACAEATHTCNHVADSTACPPGQSCVVQQNGCTPFQPCSNSAQCQNNDLCDGVEACVNGACHPGTPVNCDDGIACTFDSCNPANGVCSHPTSDAACTDGIACNGQETCSAQTGCVLGVPVSCDDGVGCTADQCLEPSGTCAHTPVNALCSDGNNCNGFEQCSASGCQPGTPIVCPDDGIACTTQVCDPAANMCVTTPHNDLCPCTQTCKVGVGCGNFCQVKTCQGKVYQCGDCLDNDGDCKVDAADDQCLGPCDNTENSFYGGIPGQNNSPCKSDCYFDADTGSGNDDCYWSHKCDSLEVAPNYTPEGSQCAYSPNANIAGYNGTCSTAFTTQSQQCTNYCGPLTPNGCDCFGCCNIPGAPTPVWLGSENPPGVGSCNSATLNDPTKCKPCTQVAACLNPCDTCELCVGKPTLPPGCVGPVCPLGVLTCNPLLELGCPANYSCITGCCYKNP